MKMYSIDEFVLYDESATESFLQSSSKCALLDLPLRKELRLYTGRPCGPTREILSDLKI
jgi:hypothetical protein